MGQAQIGFWLCFVVGPSSGAGMVFGGMLCDKMGKKDIRWQMWICAISGLLLIPFFLMFLFMQQHTHALACLVPVIFFGAYYVGPSYALAQTLAKLRMRALAAAIVMFFINLLGLGLGPLIIGMLNDALKPTYGADAIRYSMIIIAITTLWAAGHYMMAAKYVKKDLEASKAL